MNQFTTFKGFHTAWVESGHSNCFSISIVLLRLKPDYIEIYNKKLLKLCRSEFARGA